jgi:electron transfer flavoprotein alpha subunit
VSAARSSPTSATESMASGADPAAGPLVEGALAVIVVRDGRLPLGADDAVAEAGGSALVVGSGAEEGAGALRAARHIWFAETATGLRPGELAATVAPVLVGCELVVMPASPDGRDLAPRVAALLERPLIARAVSVEQRSARDRDHSGIRCLVARLDDRVLVPIETDVATVVTLAPSGRATGVGSAPVIEPVALAPVSVDGNRHRDPEVTAVLAPDVLTMDLADATRVVGGGAGLVAGLDDGQATEVFDRLIHIAGVLGASAGATRVATDAGWIGYERQIGTTGVTVDPELYVALGISGATQHIGGLGAPRHIVSVNTDSSSPMTAMADLGLVTDARAFLAALAERLSDAAPGTPQQEEMSEEKMGTP